MILDVPFEAFGSYLDGLSYVHFGMTSKEANTNVKDNVKFLFKTDERFRIETMKCLKKCRVCKRKAHYNRTWNIPIHKKCLRSKLVNICYFEKPFFSFTEYLPYETYRGCLRNYGGFELYYYYAFWKKNDDILPDKSMTVDYFCNTNVDYLNAKDRYHAEQTILKVRRYEAEAKYRDAFLARMAISDAKMADQEKRARVNTEKRTKKLLDLFGDHFLTELHMYCDDSLKERVKLYVSLRVTAPESMRKLVEEIIAQKKMYDEK